MSQLRFVWDPGKEKVNERKHDVSFEEAQSAFYDENAKLIHDPDHSDEEERYVLLGFSKKLRLLLVCHCYREDEEVIRIISARKANHYEKEQYGR